MGAAFIKRRAAVWAGRAVEPGGVLPGRCRRLERQVFEHARTRAREPCVQFGFNLAQGRFGVLDTPLCYLNHNFAATATITLPQKGRFRARLTRSWHVFGSIRPC